MKVKELLPQYDFQYGEFDVSEDRDKYIGGSDIPVICGISPFKTRWQLLLEKAGLEQSSFSGNKYTEYGHIIEPKIREHINNEMFTNFQPTRLIHNDLRLHTDGFNGQYVLEVKSTSQTHEKVEDYKMYLVQLLKYMEEHEVENGILAVYKRPEDMSPEFDVNRLQLFFIKLSDFELLLAHVNKELNKFRKDLERLKENPLLSEHDFLPQSTELVTLANKVAQFEAQLASMKELEEKCKKAKKELYDQMMKHDVKSWTMPNGTKLTRVDEVPSSTKEVVELDEEAFKNAYPLIHAHYCVTKVKKVNGKSGYVRITTK
jgi:putative phage-type endonuclease